MIDRIRMNGGRRDLKIMHYAEVADLSFRVPWIDLMKELANQGIEQVLLCRAGGNLEQVAVEAGIETITWKPMVTNFPPANLGYPHLLKSLSPDIVHTRLSSAAYIAGFWGKYLKIPTVAMIDGFSYKKKYYKNADRYMACSVAAKESMVTMGLPHHLIDVVYNSIDVPKYSKNISKRTAFRESHHILPHEKVFVGAGSFSFIKGFDILIDAFAYVASSDENVRLLIAGDGQDRKKYLDRACSHNLREKIIFSGGYVGDIRPWLWGADFFVLPSRAEPFGIITLEAMAAELPVIVTDSGGSAEIITNGIDGLVVPVDNSRLMADAMKKMLIMDTPELERMLFKAKSRLDFFTSKALASRQIAVYEKMLATV